MKLTPAQVAMAQLHGRQLPMGPRKEVRDRVLARREFLVQITGRDFGYDAFQWHEYLWDTDAGGYDMGPVDAAPPR